MKKPLFALVLLIVVLAWGTATSQAEPEGSMVVGMETTVSSFDCWFVSNTLCLVLSKIWGDTLVNIDPEDPSTLVPGLALSWEQIDPTTVRMELRQGVTFHNGQPFTAEDVKATLEFMANTDNGARLSYGVSWLAEVRIIDDYTVDLVYNAPNAPSLQRLAQLGTIYPSGHYFEAGTEAFGAAPVGTGPYRLVEWVQDQRAIFEPNPDYFGGPKGMPALERLEIRFISEPTTRISELLSGSVDVISEVPADQVSLLEGARLDIHPIQTNAMVFINLDSMGRSGSDTFTDRRVREAVAHAIDKQSLIDQILGGYAEPLEVMATRFMFGYSEDVPTYDYDPALAQQLLADAGAAPRIEVEYVSWIPQRQALEAIIGYLEEIGFDASLRYLGGDIATFSQLEFGGEIPFYSTLWTTVFDADAVLCPFLCAGAGRSFDNDPEIQQKLVDAAASIDPDERRALYRDVLQKINEEVYLIPLFSPQIVFASDADVDFTNVVAPDYPRLYALRWKP